MRLLLAEDEKSLAKATAVILEKNNFSVDVVYDGQEALDWIENATYDGIILDIMMPKMDGIAVLKKMRANLNLTPVLLLTAKSEVDDKVLGLDSGANDYLTKPFAGKELLARIRAMTRNQTGQSNQTNQVSQADNKLHLGNLTLDQTDFTLSTSHGSYRLANKEFQMMTMFLRYPKNLISAEHFLEQIWGYDTETEINSVWVYISYLRKKLENLQANVQITALRGVGYTLEEKR